MLKISGKKFERIANIKTGFKMKIKSAETKIAKILKKFRPKNLRIKIKIRVKIITGTNKLKAFMLACSIVKFPKGW